MAPPTEAYCVCCKKKVPLVDPTEHTNARGVGMWKSVCTICKSRLNTFKKKELDSQQE
jgi:hypothetical protein